MTTEMNTNPESNLLTFLLKPKPIIHAYGAAPVLAWKDCWAMFLYQIPQMWKNKEEWFYYHRGAKQTMCGTDELLQREFVSLQSQGLKPCDDSAVNEKKIWCIVSHPKKKKTGLRCDLSFRRFLGEEDEEGNCKGAGMCPLLWGLGGMGDGVTYMNVKITEVPLPKDQLKVSLDLVNRVWARNEEPRGGAGARM